MTKVLIGFRQQKEPHVGKINDGLYSSESHDWLTPPELVNALLAFEGRAEFDLDPCCSERNIPADMRYAHPEHNGLALPWSGVLTNYSPLVWVNPPYGNLLAKFMAKMAEEAEKGARIWAIVPARTETRYQHEHGLVKAGFTVFMKKRICFLRPGFDAPTAPTANAPFPTMLLYYGDDWAEKAVRWEFEPAWPGSLMICGTEGRALELAQAYDDFYRIESVA